LQLLRLLEPERYQDLSPQAQERFRDLYAAQEDIGRRLRRLTRAVDGFQGGETEREQVERLVSRLLQLPVLQADSHLRELAATLPEGEAKFGEAVRSLVDYVATHFRINRRILKNRRQQLIDADRLRPVQRRLEVLSYVPEQLEQEAADAAGDLVRAARDHGMPPEVLAPFTSTLFQALISAERLREMMETLRTRPTERAGSRERAYVSVGHLTGYAEWPGYVQALHRATRAYLPDDLLERAWQRAQAWADSYRSHTRRERLLGFLRERAKEDPRPKLLIFAGYPGASAEIAEAIRAEFGETAIREFRFDLEWDAKEEHVREFQMDPSVWILVSDETAGEGRNFQFVDELVHVDTPWNVAKMEQRVGRLDRLGRAQVREDVISNVLLAEDSVEAALVECFGEGVRVYQESISGLEFALREVEESIIDRVSTGGPDALRAYIPEAKDALEMERARDASEALFDQASFDRAVAERLQRVRHDGGTEEQLQRSFVRYLRAISSRSAVRECNDPYFPGAVWKFSPEDFRLGVLPAEMQQRPDLFQERIGTFRRNVAQQRLDLEFFTIGNPFFDTIVQSLWDGAVGRTYAVFCELPGEAPWVGLEFAFRAEPNWTVLQGQPGLINQASMLFSARPLTVFVRCDGSVDEQHSDLLNTRSSLRMPEKGTRWEHLKPEHLRILTRDRWGEDWQMSVQTLYATARADAREKVATRLAHDLATEHERVHELIRQAVLRGDEDEEVDALQSLITAVDQWTLSLDSAGFLAINPPES
jgi:ATP-dependent helicase HepA